jgi:hypothetical protein
MFRFAQHDTGHAKCLDSTRLIEPKLRRTGMKRLLGIFELSKNEQRVVLMIMLALLAVAFIGYERRVHRSAAQSTPAAECKPSPSPVKIEEDR